MLDYLLSVGGFSVLALLAITIFYTAASIRVIPWVLSRPLLFGFHQFAVSDVPAGRTVIVLLGSGSFTVHGPDERLGVIDPTGASRVIEAAHVYHVLGSPWIISSGGAAGGFQTEPSAATMRAALVQVGVPADRIVLESTSRDTHDEAVLVAPMLRALQADHVVLVTSDVHEYVGLAYYAVRGWLR